MWTLLKSWNSSSEPSLSDQKFLSYLKDKTFDITHVRQGVPVTERLVVTRANGMALLCKTPKGATCLIDTLDLRQAVEIAPPVVIPKIVVRTLSEVTAETVRQHLADRHGFLVPMIGDDADLALLKHTDHHGFPLGHQHEAPRDGQARDLTPEEVDRRAAKLNAEYEHALECASCGYIRLPEEEGKKFFRFVDVLGMASEDTPPEELLHCEDCKDEEEFEYK